MIVTTRRIILKSIDYLPYCHYETSIQKGALTHPGKQVQARAFSLSWHARSQKPLASWQLLGASYRRGLLCQHRAFVGALFKYCSPTTCDKLLAHWTSAPPRFTSTTTPQTRVPLMQQCTVAWGYSGLGGLKISRSHTRKLTCFCFKCLATRDTKDIWLYMVTVCGM